MVSLFVALGSKSGISAKASALPTPLRLLLSAVHPFESLTHWAEPGAGRAAGDPGGSHPSGPRGGRCTQAGTGLGATAASTKARERWWRETTGETLVGPPRLAPLPRNTPREGRGRNWEKKETARALCQGSLAGFHSRRNVFLFADNSFSSQLEGFVHQARVSIAPRCN